MLRRVALPLLVLLLALPAAALAHGSEVTHADTPGELADGSIVRALSTAGGSGTATGLPTSWCGTRLLADDVVHAAQPPTTAVVKVVYAYAADRTDRSATWTPALQGNASAIGRFLAEQSAGGRAVGFDMGTSCGPQYLDVTVVPLPQPRATYLGNAGFDALRDDALAALGSPTGPRDVLIMADQLATTSAYGLGEVLPGADEPGAENPHNGGRLTAAIYSPPGSSPGSSGWQPTMMLHEITHNLGAVAPSAPHSTPNGHCWDGNDVMCYDDASTGSQPYTRSVCPSIPGTITDVYDCGRDDYYDPAAAPGSYLDTHWNVYRSVFMSPCTALGLACGDLARTLAPPVSSAPPEVQGTSAAAPQPAAPTAVPLPKSTPSPAATPLQIVLRGGGRLAARLTARVASVPGGVAVTSATVRARAARGRWRLKLCAAAVGQPRRCALGPRAQAAHGTVRLAAARVLLRSTSKRITVTAALVGSGTRPAARGTASTA